jgi:serine/threonine-protein kinase
MTAVTQILCPRCRRENLRRARYCQHCGRDVVLSDGGTRQFFITRVIKEGGQGAVFAAIDAHDHVYAVKQMLDQFTSEGERAAAVERFEAEAALLRGLKHPRIPAVFASYQDEGYHYLVMEFVVGDDLEDIVRQRGRIDEASALRWAGQVCDVLQYLHHQPIPIIFRDVKPSNIMITPDGDVKLVDFGIAKTFNPTRQQGTQIGTPGYAPPEQYQGLATPQSDLYALAATLHHLLSGRDPREHPPFSFPPLRDLVPTVSQRTATVLQRALMMRKEDRYENIAAFRDALIPASATPGNAVGPALTVPIPGTPPPASRRMWRGCATLALVISIGLGGLAASYLVIARPPLFASTPTPSLVGLIAFSVDNIELVIPPERDVDAAFLAEFERRAREIYGADARIPPGVPPAYVGAAPAVISRDGDGTQYRASMTGWISVP